MTTVSAVMRRSYKPAMFDDLALVGGEVVTHTWDRDEATGIWTLTFDGDLTDEQQDAIWARMESTDDTDQTRREALRADHDALTEDDPLRRLYCYALGD